MIHNPEGKPRYILFTIHSVYGPSHRYIYSQEEARAEVEARKAHLTWWALVDTETSPPTQSEEIKDV